MYILEQNNAETMGERLAHLRAKNGLNQAEFAALLGFPARTYVTWERDEAKPPIELLKQLNLKLEVTLEWILYGRDSPQSENASVDWERWLRIMRRIDQVYAKFEKGITGEAASAIAIPIFSASSAFEEFAFQQLEAVLANG